MKSSLAAFVTAIEAFVAAHPAHARLDRAAAHLRRGRPAEHRRHGEGRRAARRARRAHRLLHRRRAVVVAAARRHDQDRPARHADRHAARARRAGARRVSGAGPKPDPPRCHRRSPSSPRSQWDRGNEHFPPTSFQCSNIHAGTGATNVVPGVLELVFNWRYSTESTREGLVARLEEVLRRHGLDYELALTASGKPFLTRPGRLVEAVDRGDRRRDRRAGDAVDEPAERPTVASSPTSARSWSSSVRSTRRSTS